MSSPNSAQLRSVQVRTLQGEVVTIQYQANAKCSEIINLLKQKFNPGDDFIVTCSGKQLYPNEYIKNYSIGKYSTLTMAGLGFFVMHVKN